MEHSATIHRDDAIHWADLSIGKMCIAEGETLKLYTAQEIADFVKGLYFDDDFRLDKNLPVFAQIAEKIEEESKK